MFNLKNRQKCYWPLSWLHQRRRISDIRLVWVSLVMHAKSQESLQMTWDMFVEAQSHWQCECGRNMADSFRKAHFRSG